MLACSWLLLVFKTSIFRSSYVQLNFFVFFKLKKHVNKINQEGTDNYEKRLAYSTTTRDAK